MTTPTLRPFTPADQEAARALILAGLGERFGFVDETRNPDLDDIAAYYPARGHQFLVAEQAGALVGTGGLLFEDDGATCQLVRVSVRRDLRRQGIAQVIVTALLSRARKHGRQRVWVETDEPWHDAIALYQRLGFAITTRRDGLVFLELALE
ncbi:MAG TPA: GNAT family N-acetyltransferase [Ktedonobacterales bacterium]|jgi:ribosomal protein S18 acetylase RimI-like enzyme|nr:GNAT family N-acetyltransferase [Ktedonobacterales bacterium]